MSIDIQIEVKREEEKKSVEIEIEEEEIIKSEEVMEEKINVEDKNRG